MHHQSHASTYLYLAELDAYMADVLHQDIRYYKRYIDDILVIASAPFAILLQHFNAWNAGSTILTHGAAESGIVVHFLDLWVSCGYTVSLLKQCKLDKAWSGRPDIVSRIGQAENSDIRSVPFKITYTSDFPRLGVTSRARHYFSKFLSPNAKVVACYLSSRNLFTLRYYRFLWATSRTKFDEVMGF